MARLTPRVIQTGAFAKAGFASAQDWLAAISGTSSSSARSRLSCCGTRRPVTRAVPAYSAGKAVGPRDQRPRPQCGRGTGGTRRPRRTGHGFLELQGALRCRKRCQVCCPVQGVGPPPSRPGAPNPALALASRRARGRPGRVSLRRGGLGPRGLGPRSENQGPGQGCGGGSEDSFDAHRLDAFVELLEASATAANGRQSRSHALVVVDAAALQRGSLGQGEHCEIEGIGSVSVEAAIELLGEAMARFVITSGRDVTSVTSSTRWIPPSTEAALVVRDRCCVVPGCGKRLGLEIDHCEVDYADGGPTTFENLARLCPEHHDMKTHGGWKLVRAKDRWRWLAPEHPPSAGRIARERRLAAIRNQRR